MTDFIRVSKEVYESATVRNGWVHKDELVAYYNYLEEHYEGLGGDWAPVGDGSDGRRVPTGGRGGYRYATVDQIARERDGLYWFHKVRNREILAVKEKMRRLIDLEFDLFVRPQRVCEKA